MKGFNILALLFYTLIIVILATALIALSLGILTPDMIIYYYKLHDLKMAAGVSGAALIIICFIVLRITFAHAVGQRSLRFKMRHGAVTVSLNAIQDITRQLLSQLPEVKEMQPRIFAIRRGIGVFIKTTLCAGISVPEISEKIQHYVKTKLQETLGSRTNITVKIQVDKIEQTRKEDNKLQNN